MNSLSDGALRLYAGEDKMLLQHGVYNDERILSRGPQAFSRTNLDGKDAEDVAAGAWNRHHRARATVMDFINGSRGVSRE